MVKKILFVCKFNRFRSKVAEAYFNKINKNKNIAVKSAGLFAGSYPLDSQQVKLAKKFGIKIKKKPRAMSAKLLSKINKIIIVADDVPKNLFLFKGKYLQEVTIWKIKDDLRGNEQTIEKIIKQIMLRVDKLNKGLNKK